MLKLATSNGHINWKKNSKLSTFKILKFIYNKTEMNNNKLIISIAMMCLFIKSIITGYIPYCIGIILNFITDKKISNVNSL